MKQKKGILLFNNGSLELSLISALLQAEDYALFETSLPLEAIHLLQKNDIDVILASQEFEGMEGQEFKELAEKIRPGINVLLLPTTGKEKASKQTVTNCSANIRELVQFIQNHIRTQNRQLTESSTFKDFFFSFTDRLLQVFEVNDKYFFNNNHLVATISRKVAEKMGLEERLADAIQISALIRDIGKVGIQHEIMDEKGRLGKDDLTIIKSHPLNTVQIMKGIGFPWNVEAIITHHHEYYEGNGYPEGLKGRQVPLGSRIISVVDSYVAMTTDRPYRKTLSREEAIQEILRKTGTQFDPEVVEIFLTIIQEEKFKGRDRKRILVLTSDEAASAFIRLNISSEEFEIMPAATSTEAIQYLKDDIPNTIIADAETLAIEKFRFYNIIRQESTTSEIPIIIIGIAQEAPQQVTDPLVEFIREPLNIDELLSKIKTVSRKEPPRPHPIPVEEEFKGVTGNLEDLTLVDIIQVLNMGLKTAKVILIKDKEKGDIYLKDGKIVNVATRALRGHEAFFELMGWDKGVFRIFHGHTIDEVNVTMDTMNLLLEASKVLDERRRKGR